jgi:hypothetical protein
MGELVLIIMPLLISGRCRVSCNASALGLAGYGRDLTAFFRKSNVNRMLIRFNTSRVRETKTYGI